MLEATEGEAMDMAAATAAAALLAAAPATTPPGPTGPPGEAALVLDANDGDAQAPFGVPVS